jgi:predicted nucleic acid-binding protein
MGLARILPGRIRASRDPSAHFRPATRVESALEALFGLLASPSLRVLNPGPRHPELFSQHLRDADARGNLAFDAQIAAVCVEHRVTALLTADRDFARFAPSSSGCH